MDFLNLNEGAREAKLIYDDVLTLFQFHRFQRERLHDVEMPEVPHERCARLAALYPNVIFQPCGKYDLTARVKPKVSGSLAEQLNFLPPDIPHLTTNIAVNWESLQIAFRSDGTGIIKEESWYEFFEHGLDLAQVRQECEGDEHALHDALEDYFRHEIGPNLDDPFFDSSGEDCSLYYESGSEEELKRLLTLCLLTEPDIAAHTDENVHIYAATEANRPYLGDNECYHSRRLEELLEVIMQENEPVGWSFEYNDGAVNRQSGYSENAECLWWHIGELLENCSARERMAARRELREYLAARKLDLARFDALAVKLEKEAVI